MILGLTGSIGSGKSFVTRCFEELGATAIRADEIAREVVLPGTPAHREILQEFGNSILASDGSIDRRHLAQVVFSNPEKRKRLERIIHPRVRDREIELIRENRQAPLIVLEIPLLFEAGAGDLCGKVLVVTVDEAVRRERLIRDRGMTAEEIEARLASQMPQEEKVRRADFVIDNSGSREQTRHRVEELYQHLLSQSGEEKHG